MTMATDVTDLPLDLDAFCVTLGNDKDALRAAHKRHTEAAHRFLRTVVLVDDYDSEQAALDAAAQRGVKRVLLNPAGTYDLGAGLRVPAGVLLDGGGHYGAPGATVRAVDAIEHLITLAGNGAGVRGCKVDANNRATVGVFARHHYLTVADNTFWNLADADGAAVRLGGALYPSLRRNLVGACAAYGLDALDAYSGDPDATYYGVNHGLSQQNVWGGRQGGIRFEGMLLSTDDDFEIRLDGEAAVVVGGTVQSQLHLAMPYFELTRGNAEALKAIVVKGSARCSMTAGQAHGDSSAGSVFLDSQTGYGLTLTGAIINRWDVGLAGVVATGMPVQVGGNYFVNVETKSTLNTSVAAVALWQL